MGSTILTPDLEKVRDARGPLPWWAELEPPPPSLHLLPHPDRL